MSEQPEPVERTANDPREHLTFAEAGERMGLSPDAVRMRAKRGKLATIRLIDRPYVLWPPPALAEQPNEPRTERTPFANRSAVQGDVRLIETLQSEVAYLRSALDAEIEARRRADHLVAGLMEQLRGLPSGQDAGEYAPGRHESSPQSGDHPGTVSDRAGLAAMVAADDRERVEKGGENAIVRG